MTFLYNDPPATPWQLIIGNNFGDLVPLYKQVYDLIRTPSVSNNIPTIGMVNVFHNRLEAGSSLMAPNGMGKHLTQLDGPMDEDVEVVLEEPSSHDIRELALINGSGSTSDKRITKALSAAQNGRSSGKGRRRTITRQVTTMSASMPTLKDLNTSDFEHPYRTRHKNASRFQLHNQTQA